MRVFVKAYIQTHIFHFNLYFDQQNPFWVVTYLTKREETQTQI